VLDAILRSVRLDSGILSRATYGEPWAIQTRGAAQPIFHAIVSGRCLVRLTNAGAAEESSAELEAGDIVVLPHGDGHVMASDDRTSPIAVLNESEIHHGGPGDECRIICGTFRLDHEAAGWLLELLPPLLRTTCVDEKRRAWITSTLGLMDAELASPGPGSETLVSRLTDTLVIETLRHHAEGATDTRGWLAAVRDERVGKALALMHQEPGVPWSVPDLAAKVGMSRTRFFARFSELVGESPARYLARWRATAAADLLRTRDVSNAELAALVGYGSEQAFASVFRRYLGVSPAAYRRKLHRN
jgi:AraC-like DNA-binding protein